METEKVGIVAGEIWHYLKKNGEIDILKLKLSLKYPNSLIFSGLGWLAREDKIKIYEENGNLRVMLKD